MKRRIFKTNTEALAALDNFEEKVIPVYGWKYLRFEIVSKDSKLTYSHKGK